MPLLYNLPFLSLVSPLRLRALRHRFVSLPWSQSHHLLSAAPPTSVGPHLRLMAAHNNNPESTDHLGPSVHKIRHLVNSDPSGGWEKCWQEGLTPWDLGRPTPILQHLLEKDTLPKGRVLVPGCGTGYDVVALASPDRYVIGLDISEVAIRKAKELAPSSPNANYASFLLEDFFTWEPSNLFDLIFDYTFFCAIEPKLRSAWATRMHDLLKPDGELITLMFPIDDHEGGPPYKTSVADYEQVLHPVGFQAISIVENDLAVGRRQGMEKLGRWRKMTKVSPL